MIEVVRPGRRRMAGRDLRQRHRHRSGQVGEGLRRLPAPPQPGSVRGNRHGPGHLQADRRAPRRPDLVEPGETAGTAVPFALPAVGGIRSSPWLGRSHPGADRRRPSAVPRGHRARDQREPDLELVAEASDGRGALDRIRELEPDVAVIDVRMPELDGSGRAGRPAEEGLRTNVVFLSAFLDSKTVYDAVAAGANAYLSKEADTDEIMTAIRAAARGRRSSGRRSRPGSPSRSASARRTTPGHVCRTASSRCSG